MASPLLPPGQQQAAPGKWPQVGERQPAAHSGEWTVQVNGLVAAPRTWSLPELRTLPQQSRAIDIHCVTRWSILGARFRGVPLASLLAEARPHSTARYVAFVAHSERQHSTSLPLADALQLDVLLALEYDGEPLNPGHGGPVRSVTPGRYFYKSVKWLSRIELLAEDRLGYWEASAGYHNRADPWREERYLAGGISRQEAARLFADRDVRGRELLSLDGSDRDLRGLQAAGAILRNANFERADLEAADFRGANLSNARFAGANLRHALLQQADLEGVDFSGCDLRGADLRGASLFGASLVTVEPVSGEQVATEPRAARLDATTRIDASAVEALMPQQAAFLAKWLSGP